MALRSGVGHIHGLLPQSTQFVASMPNLADAVGEAIADMAGKGYLPSLVVMHPSTFFSVQGQRDNSNGYVAGGWSAPQPARLCGFRS